ncbi:zinc finger BED domain-containing protein 4-like [Ixodes scapularis]
MKQQGNTSTTQMVGTVLQQGQPGINIVPTVASSTPIQTMGQPMAPQTVTVKVATTTSTSVTQPLSIQTTVANSQSAATTPSQMSPNTAKKKCKNFLSTLIRLASDQPEQVASNVKGLIQGLIDGTIQPEDFTNQLQKELNSSPQPCLVPFLKKSLPYLRHSLMTKELTIEGVRPPPQGAVTLPSTPAIIPNIQLLHKEEYAAASASKKQRTLDSTLTLFQQQAKKKLAPSDAFQKKFNQHLAEMIAVDGLPLSFTKGVGFNRLIDFLKPELNVMSPRTMSRILEDLAKKVAVPALSRDLSQCAFHSLHFIVDLWSSRTRDSIIGIKVQFVLNWELRTCTLAFKHFPGHHTGDHIREAFENELLERGVQKDQIGCVVCDNASNMTKAFNMSMLMNDKWHVDGAADGDIDEEEASPEECSTSEIDVSEALCPCHRIRCAAHTLQLAVNGAIRNEEAAKELIDVVNRVINIFRRSSYWTGRLKDLCGKDLVPATGTRWNSILAALKRLTQTDVFDAVELVVQEHNEAHRAKAVEAGPPTFTLSRLGRLQGLLKPLGDATDRLQGDGVTSAIVHLCVSTCYAQIKNYPAEE